MANTNIDTSEVERRLQDIETRTMIKIKIDMSEYAKQMEGYAKRNKPWTNHTHRAVQSLHGVVRESGKGKIDVGIAHGVWYGTSLEFGHEKRYAILFPTLKEFTSRIMNSFRNIMEG